MGITRTVRYAAQLTVAASLGFLTIGAAQARPVCLDPDENSPSGKRMLEAGLPCNRSTPDQSVAPRRSLSAVEKAAIVEAVTAQMKDPLSAQFKWPMMRGDAGTYCGYVNAKNSFGGYVGFHLFAVFVSREKRGQSIAFVQGMAGEAAGHSASARVVRLCAEDGY